MKLPQSLPKGLLLIGLALVCLLLMVVLISQLFTQLNRHEVCSINADDHRVTVYRIGWASGSGEAKFQVMIDGTPLLEFRCVGEFMTTPSAAISLSDHGILIQSVGGDDYDIAVLPDLSSDTPSAVWCFLDSDDRPVFTTDADTLPYFANAVIAIDGSVSLSYNSRAFLRIFQR